MNQILVLALCFLISSCSHFSLSRKIASVSYCEGKILNPCSGQKGKPYRKYKCFSYEDGLVVAYKSAAKRKSYSNYSNLNEFLNESKVLVSCTEALGAVPVKPKPEDSGLLPISNRPPPTELTLPIVENPIDFYYGEEGPGAWIQKGIFPNNVKGSLYFILSAKHIQSKGSYDKLVDKCPGETNSNEICVSQISYGYKGARKFLHGKLHLKIDKENRNKMSIEDVYCNRYISKDDYSPGVIRLPGILKIPDHEVINTEHSWPQSRFNENHSRDFQKADLHHLFPTDTKVNRIRSNYQFGEVEPNSSRGEQHDKCNFHRRGNAIQIEGIPDTGNTDFFEPPSRHKGNIARAIFYFSTRYELEIKPLEEYYLRKWHKEDPVDHSEEKRANDIYLLQGIRNPFIDHPELVDAVEDF